MQVRIPKYYELPLKVFFEKFPQYSSMSPAFDLTDEDYIVRIAPDGSAFEIGYASDSEWTLK